MLLSGVFVNEYVKKDYDYDQTDVTHLTNRMDMGIAWSIGP